MRTAIRQRRRIGEDVVTDVVISADANKNNLKDGYIHLYVALCFIIEEIEK